MARKRKVDALPPGLEPSRPRRDASPEEKLAMVYMDGAVHQGFLGKEHVHYIMGPGFQDLASLLWSDKRFKSH